MQAEIIIQHLQDVVRLTRTGQGQCQFTLFDGATFDYGQVIMQMEQINLTYLEWKVLVL